VATADGAGCEHPAAAFLVEILGQMVVGAFAGTAGSALGLIESDCSPKLISDER
jgi:hypothetical protein